MGGNGGETGRWTCKAWPLWHKQEEKEWSWTKLCAFTHTLTEKKLVTERTKTSGSEKEGVLIERRRQAAGAGAAALLLALLFSTTGSMSGILVGWNHLPLCTPAASVCQAIDPSPFLHRQRLMGKKKQVGGWGGTHMQNKSWDRGTQFSANFYTPSLPTHTITLPLCSIPLTALDLREGQDIRERIHQISSTMTKTAKEC